MTDAEVDIYIEDTLLISFQLLCLAVIVPILSFLIDLNSCNNNLNFLFQRNGAISVGLCALIQFKLVKIDGAINPTQSNYGAVFRWREKYLKRYDRISTLTFIILFLSTIIWGYGDMPFK